jgi:hypothetical protein
VFDPRAKRMVLAGGMSYRATTQADGRVTFSLQRAAMPLAGAATAGA